MPDAICLVKALFRAQQLDEESGSLEKELKEVAEIAAAKEAAKAAKQAERNKGKRKPAGDAPNS